MEHGNLYLQSGIMVILLLLSAFFSGSETAYFSLNSLEKDSLKRRSTGRKAAFIARLFSHPDEILVTILTGNMFVNVFSSSIAEGIGARIFGDAAEIVSIVSMTVLLLIFGEMTPKNLAIRHALKFSSKSTTILRMLHNVLKPFTHPLGRLRHSIISVFPKQESPKGKDQTSAVLSAIRMGYRRQTISESELRLLERFFRFRRKTASDVMKPRVDLHPVDETTTVSGLRRFIASGEVGLQSSLIPVFRGNVDNLSGYVRRIDLISSRFEEDTRILADIKKPVHVVPEGKHLRVLLDEMGRLGTEMAVVVDQYGGTDGLVSFPGLVSYLFSDFRPQQERSIERTDSGSFRIAGHADVSEVAAEMNIDLPLSHHTMAGMLINELGAFPEANEEVAVSGYIFRVTDVDGHKVLWIEAREDTP